MIKKQTTALLLPNQGLGSLPWAGSYYEKHTLKMINYRWSIQKELWTLLFLALSHWKQHERSILSFILISWSESWNSRHNMKKYYHLFSCFSVLYSCKLLQINSVMIPLLILLAQVFRLFLCCFLLLTHIIVLPTWTTQFLQHLSTQYIEGAPTETHPT